MNHKAEQAKVISNKIKELRENLGWNQAKLAVEAGISGAALSKIEQGEQRIPTIVVLRKLANALKVELHEITGEAQVDRSVEEQKQNEFYRKFSMIEELSKDDQEMLLDMAKRFKDSKKK